MGDEEMTMKEIVNLINELQARGISDSEIIQIIKNVESKNPKDNEQKESR